MLSGADGPANVTEKRECSACGGEYPVTMNALIRQHKSSINSEFSCPGSGKLPKDHGPRPEPGVAAKVPIVKDEDEPEKYAALRRMNAAMELAAGFHVSIGDKLVKVWKDPALEPGDVVLSNPRYNEFVAYFNPPPIEDVIPAPEPKVQTTPAALPRGVCDCGYEGALTKTGKMRAHNRDDNSRCSGSGKPPATFKDTPTATIITTLINQTHPRTSDEAVADAVIETGRTVETVELPEDSPIGPSDPEADELDQRADEIAAYLAKDLPFEQPERDFEWEGLGRRQYSTDEDAPFEQPSAETTDEALLLFEQPDAPKRRTKREPAPVSNRAYARAERFRNDFARYQASRPRSTQLTIGPSEVGAECDRRMGYAMTNHPVVNHHNDSWAAWVGTQGHTGLEDMYRWLDAGQSRWLVDQEVEFPYAFMPRGKVDQFDRMYGRVEDNKFPGTSTLRKMHIEGQPSIQYQVQLHVYGLGLKLMGEDVREVGLIGLPRESGNLKDMFTWVDDWNEKIALDAIQHAGEVANYLQAHGAHELKATPSFLCGWCPFYLPGSPNPEWGCSAK